ncbi:MAG: DNRLRE domain-containing protein [Phycisphaerales bacterium]|nr:DNRLRE domain-containing protein [Phycisphaerales bacterium]
MRRSTAFLVGICWLFPISTFGDVASVNPSKDNTLYQDAGGALSNGIGTGMFTGKNNVGSIRRGVLAFDLAGVIPAGSTINGVTLTMNASMVAGGDQTVSLHRLSADWGEGTSNAIAGGGGGGAPSTTNDATWVHRFFNTSLWSAVGGDFVAAPSGSTAVDAAGSYSWGSTPGMIADVEAWLAAPASNFGWIVRGNEGVNQTTKRFDTREIGTIATRPLLEIDFTPPAGTPAASQWAVVVVAMSLAAVATVAIRRRRAAVTEVW